MTYAGNGSLSSAVKDRVVSTFQQTLALYHQGRTDEVAAGCNLILQMDPLFEPARKLLDKTRNPGLSIDVDALMPVDGRSAMQQAREAMAARDFQRVVHITTDVLTNDLLNDEARVLGDEAREKLEAAPFIDQFIRKCDQSIAAGNLAAAKMDLEKARSLDPTHPEVVRVAKVLATRDATPSAPAATPSFIVEEKQAPPTGRSTAQAADFGFSFEEDKPAEVSFANVSFDSPAPAAPAAPAAPDFTNFSFDSPASGSSGFAGFSFGESEPPQPAAPAPAATPSVGGAAEFDFATASVVTSSDDQKKIEQYLTDGDRAFSAGEYQQAIDLWSRIFLIDVTNDEASERIERAKAKRREIEQRTEPLLAAGITAFERGDTAKAQSSLSEVLRLDPHNATAQEYLERLSEAAEAGAPASSIPPSTHETSDYGLFEDEPSGSFESLVPPAPAEEEAPAPKAKKQKKEAVAVASSAGRRVPMALVAAIAAVVLLGAGWFVWTRFVSKPAADPAATQGILTRASTLASAGKYDQAIALLQDIQPDDPQHDQALVMIADLRAKKSTSAQLIDGVPAAQYYGQRLTAGRAAFEAHDYVGAKAAFEQAQRVKPLPPDLKSQYDIAAQQVAKLDSAKAMFAERKFAEAMATLQPLLDQDPENQNIRRMILDAHFNLGATALQEERLTDAMREFDEVLKVNPNDELAKRSRDLAARYEGQPKDLLYKIYVKYLPLRQMT